MLNAPADGEEAIVLMESVDAEAANRGWSRAVARQFRGRMKGRLLSAGMTEEDVDRWIASGTVSQRKDTNRKARVK